MPGGEEIKRVLRIIFAKQQLYIVVTWEEDALGVKRKTHYLFIIHEKFNWLL